MPRTLKILLITIVVVACGYYALRFIASVQIAASFTKCIEEVKLPPGQKRFKSEEDARAYAATLFKCMDRRNSFLAKLFFDEKQANRELTYSE